jgi:uncharacterized integral membrane protein (TIGR00698 family)
MTWQKLVFAVLVIFCLSPYGSPPAALGLGIVLAFTAGSPYPHLSERLIKLILRVSVVLLGFGMDLRSVYQAGKDGLLFAVVTILGTLIVGYFLGRILGVGSKTSTLVSSGTAICGGSAIAAIGPAIDAEPDEMSVSLATVFVLNSVALFAFPLIGHSLGLTQNQFGIWAAVAIHDTSSVVGAAGTYGADALATATTVKLVRALWIAPVALFFAFIYQRKKNADERTKVSFPWFILLFVLATAFRTYAPPSIFPSIFDSIVNLAKAGMVVTLFLIGSILTPRMIRSVGAKPLVQGLILWILVSVLSLWAVLHLL